MRYTQWMSLVALLGMSTFASAQRGEAQKGPVGDSQIEIGKEGVVWYATWDLAVEEATRSNRPIFFMAAACQKGSVSGIFWPGYTRQQNSLFAQKEFIELSREFVCLRLETYESEANQALVRKYLNGKLANTAFVVLSPDGKRELSRASRSPSMSFGAMRSEGEVKMDTVLDALENILEKYAPKGDPKQAAVPDFYSFKQALNISSADQRLLVFSVAPESKRTALREQLEQVSNASSIRGKFHYDTASNTDAEWSEVIDGVQHRTGHFIIRAGEFGLKGEVVGYLPLGTSPDRIKSLLLKINAVFMQSERPKNYAEHSSRGREMNISFSNNMSHGVDKNKDGAIDNARQRRR